MARIRAQARNVSVTLKMLVWTIVDFVLGSRMCYRLKQMQKPTLLLPRRKLLLNAHKSKLRPKPQRLVSLQKQKQKPFASRPWQTLRWLIHLLERWNSVETKSRGSGRLGTRPSSSLLRIRDIQTQCSRGWRRVSGQI